MAFEFGDGSRSDDDGINVEFFSEFAMPLVAEVGWTKDGNAANVSAIEKFSRSSSAPLSTRAVTNGTTTRNHTLTHRR